MVKRYDATGWWEMNGFKGEPFLVRLSSLGQRRHRDLDSRRTALYIMSSICWPAGSISDFPTCSSYCGTTLVELVVAITGTNSSASAFSTGVG